MLKVSIEYKVYKVGGAAMYIPMLDPVAVGKAVAFYRNQKRNITGSTERTCRHREKSFKRHRTRGAKADTGDAFTE